MKICRLAFVLLFACAPLARAADRHVAFERNDAVWIANLDSSGERKITAGIFPAISPDGTRIALTTVEKSGTAYVRHIAVAEIVAGKTTVFKDVPSDNAYYPQWSPDGKRIVFTLRQNEVWNLATIAPDGTDFRILKKGAQNEATLYSPSWARDEGSIFYQDMTNIYQISLDGRVLTQWKIEKAIPNGGMSGDGRITVSADGKLLLLSFEIATQKVVRITPKMLFGWDGCWIDRNNILFLSQAEGEKSASLYRMSIDGKNLKRLITDAR